MVAINDRFFVLLRHFIHLKNFVISNGSWPVASRISKLKSKIDEVLLRFFR